MDELILRKYTDFEDLFERFAIMTTDGGLSDSEAINILAGHTSINLLMQLEDDIAKFATKSAT